MTLSYEIYDEEDCNYYHEEVAQLDSEEHHVYLVATKMNCIRKVSESDLSLVVDSNAEADEVTQVVDGQLDIFEVGAK